MMERTLHRDYYLSEKIFQLEQERIFYREWFCAGREEDLARPGDYQVLDVAGESILVVRNREGIYPNFMISLSADHVTAYTVWPRAPGHTTIICDFLFDLSELAGPSFDPGDVTFCDTESTAGLGDLRERGAGNGISSLRAWLLRSHGERGPRHSALRSGATWRRRRGG
jgi:hypothetical protein